MWKWAREITVEKYNPVPKIFLLKIYFAGYIVIFNEYIEKKGKKIILKVESLKWFNPLFTLLTSLKSFGFLLR